MSEPYLAAAERHLVAKFSKGVADRKADVLLRKEAGDLPHVQEASRILAQGAALGVLHDLARILPEIRAAHESAPGNTDPDFRRVGHALAVVASRKATKALHAALLAARKETEEAEE